jgi:FKBP-type peptidyl-prolyl cis-trans isomerase (trigger factor)
MLKHPSKLSFRIDILPDELNAHREKVIQRAIKDVQVRGFRKGKAPRHLSEKLLDPEKIFSQALNSIIPIKLEEKLLQEKQQSSRTHLILVADPILELVPADSSSEVISVSATVFLYPEVDTSDIESLKFAKPAIKEVTSEDLDSFITNLKSNYLKTKPDSTATELSEEVLAEVFGLKDKAELLQRAREELEARNKYTHEHEFEEVITQTIIKHYQDRVDIPDVMVQREVTRIRKSIDQQLNRIGATFDQYLESRNKSRGEIEAEILEEARNNVLLMVILTELVRRWDIQLDDSQEQQIASQKQNQDTLRLMLKQRKALERLKLQV